MAASSIGVHSDMELKNICIKAKTGHMELTYCLSQQLCPPTLPCMFRRRPSDPCRYSKITSLCSISMNAKANQTSTGQVQAGVESIEWSFCRAGCIGVWRWHVKRGGGENDIGASWSTCMCAFETPRICRAVQCGIVLLKSAFMRELSHVKGFPQKRSGFCSINNSGVRYWWRREALAV